jgi:hypothetical protein
MLSIDDKNNVKSILSTLVYQYLETTFDKARIEGKEVDVKKVIIDTRHIGSVFFTYLSKSEIVETIYDTMTIFKKTSN